MPAEDVKATAGFPVFRELIPAPVVTRGRYRVDFARNPDDLETVQRLRYRIFNLELGEGLEESHATGLDRDRYDPFCHHLLVSDATTNEVVGTYRMQTSEMAAAYQGFYSSDEFSIEQLPESVIRDAVEIGRASVAKQHRNRQVLFLLWQGLAAYMIHNRKRYLFGCCSLTSQDPIEGKRVMEHLVREGRVHPEYRLEPREDWRCYDERLILTPEQAAVPVEIPRLFRTYLRYEAKVCGPPAIDRFFKTIDYLVLLDIADLDDDARRMFFASST